jgi:hypothetical protein
MVLVGSKPAAPSKPDNPPATNFRREIVETEGSERRFI